MDAGRVLREVGPMLKSGESHFGDHSFVIECASQLPGHQPQGSTGQIAQEL
jgi:hypothetical protein